MNAIIEAFAALHGVVFEHAVLPTLFALGFMDYSEQAFDATEFVLLGVVQILVVYALLRPLEARFPAERWADRKNIRTDVLYTFLHRIGLVPIAIYALLKPLIDVVDAQFRTWGYIPPGLENFMPALEDRPLVTFLLYLLLFDFADYCRHRLQHRWGRWWALHSLHHSQRQMSFWTEDRNHLLDDVIAGLWFAAVAFVVGVPPQHFVAAIMLMRFVESLSHANVRFGFGRLGDMLLVSPRFHRTHHALGIGHQGAHFGCNFATLFPLWDIAFGTANFTYRGTATGVADQLEGRDYGSSFLSQQWLGLKRMVGLA